MINISWALIEAIVLPIIVGLALWVLHKLANHLDHRYGGSDGH